MHKCMARWQDPAQSREAPVGPYSCGRAFGHKGAHAHAGYGAYALWTDEELLMAVQQVEIREEPPTEFAEALDPTILEGSTDG